MAKYFNVYVPMGSTLEIVTDGYSAGVYQRVVNAGSEPATPVALSTSADVTIGPFNEARSYQVILSTGDSCSFTVANNIGTDSVDLSTYAPLASPTFTGVPVLPVGFKIGTTTNTTTGAELNYVHGVTSAVQTQLTAALTASSSATMTNKTYDAAGTGNVLSNVADTNIKAAAAIAVNKLAATTASKALVSDASGFLSASATTATELGYVAGATSSLQTQLGTKALKGVTVIAPVDTGGAEFTAVPNTVTAVNSIITALIAAGILAAS